MKYTLEVDAETLKTAEGASTTLKNNMVWLQTPPHTMIFMPIGLMSARSDAQLLKTTLDAINNQTYRSTVEITTKIKKAADGQAFAGGHFKAGQNILVGERGPEAFVTGAGQISMLGQNGPEIKHFRSSGYVVPAHVTASGINDGTVPEKYMSAIASGTATATRERTTTRASSDTQVIEQHVHIGSITQATPFDVVTEVKRAMREADRDRRERG
jgi:hypothetical protein